jgi:hypothetical protein
MIVWTLRCVSLHHGGILMATERRSELSQSEHSHHQSGGGGEKEADLGNLRQCSKNKSRQHKITTPPKQVITCSPDSVLQSMSDDHVERDQPLRGRLP